MKQIIPFTKDIAFKSTIGELTSISLDHDLQLKGEDLITGNFYVKGKYKLTKASQLEEDFSYKIPCDIAISDEYDTFDAVIDIDDFYYDVIDNEILKVNISLCIDNLIKKEKIETDTIIKEERCIDVDENPSSTDYFEEEIKEDELMEEITIEDKKDVNYYEKEKEPKIIFNYESNTTSKKRDEFEQELNNSFVNETKNEIFNLNDNDTYTTYIVYLVQDNDTFEKIEERYNCKKEDILLYNQVTELTSGMKLVIPFVNNEQIK